jgi:hypothetical protein
MKSNKQRRAELTAKREARRKKEAKQQAANQALKQQLRRNPKAKRPVKVNTLELARDNSYSFKEPHFVKSGLYVDIPFRCRDCGKKEIWTATQQKWWYEVAKGGRWTTATRCRNCRRRERQRVAEARRVHREGLARKQRMH